ncbi:chemotaxis protein CheW [Sporosarcina highlanderae]|uniref:Chemotaxis protein CheW n=1 Tax=Sporosarcina highlanderae TaxID=3035916 RepID=A0ABT8JRG6_9BACL|nr:chemotaxis protein CheW [Sporosarcina highlanderae]MDN4607751.1 chemotaxis protein CheW [Sporosarcina highlanderae]
MGNLKAVIVQCGQEEYALPLNIVISVEKLQHVNPIPHLPEYMLGLMKIRGELVPILDFQWILYDNSAKEHKNAKVVVVKTEGLDIGLLVLDAKEILDISKDQFSSSELLAHSKTPYFTTIANLEERMITVVDPQILSERLTGMEVIGDYIRALKAKEM